jgi:hypothetical protein
VADEAENTAAIAAFSPPCWVWEFLSSFFDAGMGYFLSLDV